MMVDLDIIILASILLHFALKDLVNEWLMNRQEEEALQNLDGK